MTIFRPCIDIDEGQVTVREYLYAGTGAALVSGAPADRDLKTAAEYSELFKSHNLTGGHIYKHSHNCDDAALAAIKAWPGVWQVGGSMSLSNAQSWLDAGASKIILRNELYDMDAKFDEDLLRKFAEKLGTDRLVVDISCRKKAPETYFVALNKWTSYTSQQVTEDMIANISSYCSELLFHPANEDGKQNGVDIEFVEMVHPWIRVPATYAGGCRLLQDLVVLERHSNSLMDLSMGSACDVYGGTGVKLEELVQWNKDVAKGSHAKKAEAFHRPSLSGDELEAEFKKFASGMGSVATGFGSSNLHAPGATGVDGDESSAVNIELSLPALAAPRDKSPAPRPPVKLEKEKDSTCICC